METKISTLEASTLLPMFESAINGTMVLSPIVHVRLLAEKSVKIPGNRLAFDRLK